MSIRFLKQLPTEQTEKSRFANLAINEILDGEVSILEAYATLKHIEDIITLIKEDPSVKIALFDELDKFPKGDTPTALGYSISRGERRTFDYSETNDVEYFAMKGQAQAIAEKVKSRERFLQSLTNKCFDSENGGFEITPPKVSYTTYPILKEVKQSIQIPSINSLPF